tara:strand:+ start:120 stop:740 length:621 start_codon:yes stop_codon:yes gene_type:complete
MQKLKKYVVELSPEQLNEWMDPVISPVRGMNVRELPEISERALEVWEEKAKAMAQLNEEMGENLSNSILDSLLSTNEVETLQTPTLRDMTIIWKKSGDDWGAGELFPLAVHSMVESDGGTTFTCINDKLDFWAKFAGTPVWEILHKDPSQSVSIGLMFENPITKDIVMDEMKVSGAEFAYAISQVTKGFYSDSLPTITFNLPRIFE